MEIVERIRISKAKTSSSHGASEGHSKLSDLIDDSIKIILKALSEYG